MRAIKQLIVVILMFTMILPTSLQAASSARQISIFECEGSVTVTRGGKKVLKGYKNMKLREGDKITTAEDAWARIKIDTYQVSKLDENTVVEISQAKKDKISLSLVSGTLYNEVDSKGASTQKSETKTPNTVFGVRGTGYVVTTDEQGDRGLGIHGEVEVAKNGDEEDTAEMTGGLRIDIDKNTDELALSQMDKEDFTVFQLEAVKEVMEDKKLENMNQLGGFEKIDMSLKEINRLIAEKKEAKNNKKTKETKGSASSGGDSSSNDKPYAIVKPSKVTKFQVAGVGTEIEINLKNTQLTIESAEKLWIAIESTLNIEGVVGIEIIDKDTLKIYLNAHDINKLPKEWRFVIPKSILSSKEDVPIRVPIVEDTTEGILELALNAVPEDTFWMSIDDGDNVLKELERRSGIRVLQELEMEIDVIGFQEYINEDGTINYKDYDSLELIPMDVTIRYKGLEGTKRTKVGISGLENKPEVPNDTQRLTTTPGAINVQSGDVVEFVVTADSAIFVPNDDDDDDRGGIVGKSNASYWVEVFDPTVSKDRKVLRFKARFNNVTAGARFDFRLSKEWFVDEEDRFTELIIVKKK